MMKKQYVTLNLENISRIPVLQHNVSPRRSLKRYWRQLSRLQKNLILTFIFFVILFGFYTVIFNSQRVLENVAEEEILNAQKSISVKSPKDEKIVNIDEKVILQKEEAAKDDGPSLNMNLEKPVSKTLDKFTVRQRAVVNAAKRAWNGYRKYAWGHDHLKPISKQYQDWFHLGLTLVDSLDTLYMMDLMSGEYQLANQMVRGPFADINGDEFQTVRIVQNSSPLMFVDGPRTVWFANGYSTLQIAVEFSEARDWIKNSFTFDRYSGDVNLFEVTIRILGGLLSAYHFSGDGLFLEKAADLGERLLPCFTKSPTSIPFSDINLVSRIAHVPRWSPDSSTSEVTTLQLEFRDLSRCTKNPVFEKVAFDVSEHVHRLPKKDGLVPIFINPNTGQFNLESEIKIGARGDSYYEYLLKQWLQTGKTKDFLKDDYIEAIEGISSKLVKTTPRKKFTFIGELKAKTGMFSPKMDHLICYLPGTLALGVYNGMPEKHMRLAEKLMETCYHMYADQPTHLAPEIAYFNYNEDSTGPDMYIHQQDTHNLLRPEFIESLWAMYQITGNETYQKWGWKVFQAIERYSKVENGYTSIGNVLDPDDTRPRDYMESFFMSETLKYLFLLFDSNRRRVDVDKYVMNSEGHPLPIYDF